jgi:hypothetical protein
MTGATVPSTQAAASSFVAPTPATTIASHHHHQHSYPLEGAPRNMSMSNGGEGKDGMNNLSSQQEGIPVHHPSSFATRTPKRERKIGLTNGHTGTRTGINSSLTLPSSSGIDMLFSPGVTRTLQGLRDPSVAAEVERAPEDTELVDLTYSQKIVLRSHFTFLGMYDTGLMDMFCFFEINS